MEVINTKVKITQGQKKILQYIEDLKRNKHFLALITRLEKESHKLSQEKDPVYESFINDFIEKYLEIERLLTIYRKKLMDKHQKIYLFLAEEYGLSMALINDLILGLFRLKDDLSLSVENDMCFISDNYDNFLNFVLPRPAPIEMDTERQTHIISYPVSIDIHKFATKRDVLDFIEKRWDFIESYLEMYTEKKVRLRKRKMDRQIVDFIWKNRKEKANRISKLITKQFPDSKVILGYEDILKIISNEKSRRTKKINLGF